MRVLFDTNLVLDLLLDRKPHSGPAAGLFARVESGELSGHIGATTVTTIHYLAAKAGVARRAVLEAALESGISNCEDAVLCEAARQVDAQAVVTRNRRDFRNAPLFLGKPLSFS